MSDRNRCEHCDERAVVPVLDKNIDQSPLPGNKYRTCCIACGAFGPMTSERHWREHRRPHVLPKGRDADVGAIIPLTEYDYAHEYRELIDRIRATGDVDADPGDVREQAAKQRPEATAIADGGQSEPKSDEPDYHDESHRFDCPCCGRELAGYPDDCTHCGATFGW